MFTHLKKSLFPVHKMLPVKLFILYPILVVGVSQSLDASGNAIEKEARIGGNIFSHAYNTLFNKGYLNVPSKPEEEKEEEPPGLCPHGGQFMEGKCIELVKTEVTGDQARANCMNDYPVDDSRLYEPNFDNPLLFKYWFKFYPDIFDAEDEEFWIGAKSINVAGNTEVQFDSDIGNNNNYITTNPFVISEVQDETVNNTPFSAGNPVDECIEIVTDEGSVDLNSNRCSFSRLSYVCEYPAAETNYVQHLW